jgi:hypothetical protein
MRTKTVGVLPGEFDWMQKGWCEQNPCKCAAGMKFGDIGLGIPDSAYCKKSESPTSPTTPKTPTAPSLKINFAIIALIAAGAYMVFGGKKN